MTTKAKAIFLMGPTASGKTDLACQLVQKANCEIISVDSALVYKDMDIGTAKPDAQLLQIAPHHLIDIIDPAASYSAADFQYQALTLMADITARGKTPLLVGGSMLYFRSLLLPFDALPHSDDELRERLNMQFQLKGAQFMHQQLQQVDAKAAQQIHPNHRQRLLRALEVFHLTGQPISTLWQQPAKLSEQHVSDFSYDLQQIAVSPADRKHLHQRIEQRFDSMLHLGFEQEVAALMARGDLTSEHNAIRCVGYRQMWDYLAGHLDYTQMREKGIIATRQLAKRQLTWLRSWPNLQRFDSTSVNMVEQVLKKLS